MRNIFVWRLSLGLLLALGPMDVEAQVSRASTSATYVESGNEWLKKGEIERAIADYDLAIAFDASAVAFYNRALALQRKGDLAGALSDYTQAIELNPRDANAYLNRGVIHDELGAREA